MKTKHEQMGFHKTDRLLIVNADDYGMCHSFNKAIQHLLLQKAISSTTLMVPCPWAAEAACFSKEHLELDVGIHLTFTSEWQHYKWGPITAYRETESLRTEGGSFHADCATFEKIADPEEVRLELFNQIKRAIAWGVDPTHLDVHMYSLLGLATGRDFLEHVFDACIDFGLPLRLPHSYATKPEFPQSKRTLMKNRIEMAEERNIVITDDLLGLGFTYKDDESYEDVMEQLLGILRNLKPGISEILIHPGFATEELRSIMPRDFQKRDFEARLFLDDQVQETLAKENIHLVRWRDLRTHQRRSINRSI